MILKELPDNYLYIRMIEKDSDGHCTDASRTVRADFAADLWTACIVLHL